MIAPRGSRPAPAQAVVIPARAALVPALAAVALLALAPAGELGPAVPGGPAPLVAQEADREATQERDLEAAADSAYEAGDRERARALYRRALERDPDDQRILLRLGLLAGWEDDFEESLRHLDRLMELNPDRADAAVIRGRVLAWAGRRDQAVDTLRGVVERNPDNVDARRALALVLRWEDRHAEAARVLEPAVEREPGNAELWEALAEAYARAEQYDRAEATYRRMMERSEGQEFLVRLRLADIRRLMGDEEAARQTYRELIPRLPAEAHLALGRMAMEDGDYVGAEEHFRRAVEADPNRVEARVMLARVLRWQGRNQAALDELREARRIEPGAGAADWRWARSFVAPRIRFSYGSAHDSDGNDMADLTGSLTVPLGRRVQASAGASWMDNVQETSTFRVAREAAAGELGLSYRSDRGWSLGVEAGRIRFLDTALEDRTNVSVEASTPSRHRLALDAGFRSEMLDWTAVILREQVRRVEGSLAARLRLDGGWELSGTGSLGEFRGEEGDNRRITGDLALSFPRWGSFRLALTGSGYSYERDLTDGYYDPDLYAKAELVGRWDDSPADWLEIGLEVSPGYRFSRDAEGLEGDWDPTIGGEADVAIVFAPGRRIQLRSSYSKSDPATLGAGVGQETGYEYWSVRGGFSWAF